MNFSKKEIESRVYNSTLLSMSSFPSNDSMTQIINSLTKTIGKDKIIDVIKKIQTKKFKVFKTDRADDFSLTLNGFIAIIDIKLYQTTHSDKITKEESSTPSILNTLNKIMVTPYYIAGTSVYYFDEIIHAQRNFYGSIIDLINVYKVK